jgi:(R,R)-butanediol dehydrogenase/meso-butanediol dehydrogenase/diacetyl reductase
MRALRFHNRGDIRLEEIDHPGPPGPNEIQVVPQWSGICGTDVHEFLAGPISIVAEPHPLTGCCLPMIMGHEATGIVKKIGSNVTTHKPGDKVHILS